MDNFADYIFGGFNDTMDASLDEAGSYSPPESAFARFGVSYNRVHGYLSVTVCIFGIVSNVLSIIVLTRKHMRSPTNFILTALAIADILVMSTYPIMAIYFYIITSPGCMTAQHSRGWINFILFHLLFIVTCHNMAMWLTVTLAIFRYIFVCQHAIAARMCCLARAKLAVAVVVVAAIVSCLPLYFVYSVQDNGSGLNRNVSCYSIVASQLAQDNPTYTQFVRWLFGVVFKILPCVLMAFFSTLLIIAMQQVKKRRARLFNKVTRIVDPDHKSNEHNRTTMMLLAVVICFIVTEIPQGILVLIWAVDEGFFNDVYIHLGDLMDMLVLVNSAVNFILYCIMSQHFRSTFKSLFVCNNIPFNLHRINLHRKVAKADGTELCMVKTETTNV
ncbi:G-protein coupled receptor dmsr-1-like [Littorina saxatilis]|uniref:G-protein coupled receptors family 1 profile domain-containing protein n=1 Tax=Littorina saxatilis TaxID=31220 RepID=A0AAN9GF75_9CAEN